jgi:acetyltransferase-like isoleucine patch superfamily enzyme
MKPRWNLGKLPASVGLPLAYFEKRDITVDCRGPIQIDKTARLGFGVTILTESHDISQGPGRMGPVVPYGVTIGAGVWVGSGSLLCGCTIGAGSIVAAGSVVRGQTVAPGVMVAGNPARVVARWNGERWEYLPGAESGYQRDLE